MRGVLQRPLPGQVLGSTDGRVHQAIDLPGLHGTYDRKRGSFVLAHNVAATPVPGVAFVLGTFRAAQLHYTLTRGSGITRVGILQIAGDSSAPSVSDTAAAVGAAGITWSATIADGVVQANLAVDNSEAIGIRLRWECLLWREP